MLSRRFFSSSRQVAKSVVTKLPNGITVVSKPGSQSTSSIGLYLNSGSRSENPFNSGVSTLAGSVVASSKAAQEAYALSGVEVSSSNAKEVTGLAVTSFAKGNDKEAFKTIKTLVGNLETLLKNESYIKDKAAEASAFAEAFETKPKPMVIEHMISTAFQGTSLALPTYGKADTLATLESMDLKSFLGKQFVASNLALVAVGEVKHDDVVKLASELSVPAGSKPAFEPFHFLGSDARFRDDTLPAAHVAISAQGPAPSAPDYYAGLVAAQINGLYRANDLYSSFQGPQLAQFFNANPMTDEFDHFSLGYSDVSLWGAYLETQHIEYLDEVVHFTLKNWNRFSAGTFTETELEQGKATLKLKLLSPAKSSAQEAEKLAINTFLHGFEESEAEIIKSIDDVSHKKVSQWAQKYLYDQDIAVAGTGQIEALFDYNRLRNDMSMMRW
ncbi:hypothetical protein KL905_000959 [Ogataea polymorpha]|nr:hypothetical protein KL937_001180 [Ogataea polymorpha]KAG7910322.1 hypothetical protein KL907_001213 [Ogataea polymorpha]KAG7910838.1 hypothetical protein KL906_001218 [Ogataea polymorpha]KAG7918616.1 hypothetical protein KL927_002073 [Ogataea polymorpha]KAG7923741.1 hypothetical protein KL905_000959 [Ogataea polymorpha]